jgi:hypothetical protein
MASPLGPVVGLDEGGQPLAVTQEIRQVGFQVGQVGHVGAEWLQPTQRNRTGQSWPPAVTLEGSVQVS